MFLHFGLVSSSIRWREFDLCDSLAPSSPPFSLSLSLSLSVKRARDLVSSRDAALGFIVDSRRLTGIRETRSYHDRYSAGRTASRIRERNADAGDYFRAASSSTEIEDFVRLNPARAHIVAATATSLFLSAALPRRSARIFPRHAVIQLIKVTRRESQTSVLICLAMRNAPRKERRPSRRARLASWCALGFTYGKLCQRPARFNTCRSAVACKPFVIGRIRAPVFQKRPAGIMRQDVR